MAVYTRTIISKNGKKSEYLYVEVAGPNGKKIKRSVGKKGVVTKAVARRIEPEIKRKIRLGQWDMIQAEIPTFDEFIPEFIAYLRNVKQNRGWKFAEESIKNFAKVFGSKKLSEITAADIEDYKRLKAHEGKKPATINRILAFTGHLFNYAKRCNKFFGNNPVSISGLLPVNNQKVRVLSTKEETLLLANAKEPLKSMIKIALLTGLRLNSIRTLKWKWVDLNYNAITIESTYSKNKKTHIHPISITVRKILLEAKLKCGDSEYVFPDAMLLTERGVSNKFKRLCAKLRIQELRFHDLRHTCGTRLAELGYDISTISKVLGHSSINMSMRYVHPKDSIRKAVEDLTKFESFTTNSATNEELESPK